MANSRGNPIITTAQVGGRAKLESVTCPVTSLGFFRFSPPGHAKWTRAVSLGYDLPQGIDGWIRFLTDSSTLHYLREGGKPETAKVMSQDTGSSLA